VGFSFLSLAALFPPTFLPTLLDRNELHCLCLLQKKWAVFGPFYWLTSIAVSWCARAAQPTEKFFCLFLLFSLLPLHLIILGCLPS